MAKKTRAKPVIPVPKHPPDSFTRSELLKAIRKVWAARRHPKIRYRSRLSPPPTCTEYAVV
jgi:hypothetical protein